MEYDFSGKCNKIPQKCNKGDIIYSYIGKERNFK